MKSPAYVLHANVTQSAEHSKPAVQMARNGQRVLESPTGETLIYQPPNYTKCHQGHSDTPGEAPEKEQKERTNKRSLVCGTVNISFSLNLKINDPRGSSIMAQLIYLKSCLNQSRQRGNEVLEGGRGVPL